MNIASRKPVNTSASRFSGSYRLDPSLITTPTGTNLENAIQHINNTNAAFKANQTALDALSTDIAMTMTYNDKGEEGILLEYDNQKLWTPWGQKWIEGGRYSSGYYTRQTEAEFIPILIQKAAQFKDIIDQLKAHNKTSSITFIPD